MQYIECPEYYKGRWPASRNDKLLFLAGGITSCPDWQQDYRKLLENEPNLILLNPRRKNFDVRDPNASDFQITWEHENLEGSDMVSFWFPEETLCPITLFELGKISAKQSKPIFVGTHPNYKRKFDVIKQLQLIRPSITVVHSLENLADQIIKYLRR